MSLLPTHQRVCEHGRIVRCQRWKWQGIRGWRIWGGIRQWGGRERQWICFQRFLDEKSYPSQTIQFTSDDHQICEVVVQGSWDVSINIEVTCLHIVTLAFCGGSDWRGGNMKSSTANVGDQNHTVCFKGNHISATLSQKNFFLPPSPRQ